jgi:hypothetical protein
MFFGEIKCSMKSQALGINWAPKGLTHKNQQNCFAIKTLFEIDFQGCVWKLLRSAQPYQIECPFFTALISSPPPIAFTQI